MKPDLHFPEDTAKELLLKELDDLVRRRDRIHERITEAVEEISEVNAMIAQLKEELKNL